jgi:hypothetical protein
LTFCSFGTRIGLRASATDILIHLVPYLPPDRQPSPPGEVDALYSILTVGGDDEGSYWLLRDSEEIARGRDLEEVIDRFGSDVHHQVALWATDHLFVHAGVVGWRGGAIVMPGRSHSGKSSLVAALVRAGATYYSDEYAVFDGQGQVQPYAKRLSLRQDTGRRRFQAVESLGGRAGTSPLPVKVLALTRYERGASWDPGTLSPGQAVLALLDNTVVARSEPESALRIFGQAVVGVSAISSLRGEAHQTAPLLLDLLT